MQIHIAENGKPAGPFSVWRIRERLIHGDLDPKTLGWHEGLTSWRPVAELPAIDWRAAESGRDGPADEPETTESAAPGETKMLDKWFPRSGAVEESESSPSSGADEPEPGALHEDPVREEERKPSSASETSAEPPDLPGQGTRATRQSVDGGDDDYVDDTTAEHEPAEGLVATLEGRPWTRFLARGFDAVLWMFVAVLLAKAVGIGLDTVNGLMKMQFLFFALFVAADTVLISAFGTTPGKALLGLHVIPGHGQGGSILIGTAFRRAFLVFTLGNALMLVIYFTAAAWVFHYIDLMRRQSTYWDRRLDLAVASVPVSPARTLLFAGLIALFTLAIGFLAGEDMQLVMREMQGEESLPTDL